MQTEFKNLRQVSCYADENDDGTFCVVNIFKDDNGMVVKQKYSRVRIRTQSDIFYNAKNPFPNVTYVEALSCGDNNELFTIEIKD